IPQDCALMGFGDYAFAEMMLQSLTTIKRPALEIGILAATRVLDSLGVLPVVGVIQQLNLLECRLV
ncbi:substrate-binding domain-containing protein, partial [Pseudomonas syringae group genomosp. 7]|uniref:substrate-binding domain-containing protein n=1 Tax=Pseudomonas syringae group genomosp. 7 TaxID=251699 RepID=UPI00376FF413